MNTEASNQTATPTPVDDVQVERLEPVQVRESSTAAAARVLDLAVVTADQLVVDARAEAESLVSTAQSKAEAIREDTRAEAQKAAAELARSTKAQSVELERERERALSGLAEEKTDLENRIATLRQQESEHRSRMRRHLNEQLSLLGEIAPESPIAVAS